MVALLTAELLVAEAPAEPVRTRTWLPRLTLGLFLLMGAWLLLAVSAGPAHAGTGQADDAPPGLAHATSSAVPLLHRAADAIPAAAHQGVQLPPTAPAVAVAVASVVAETAQPPAVALAPAEPGTAVRPTPATSGSERSAAVATAPDVAETAAPVPAPSAPAVEPPGRQTTAVPSPEAVTPPRRPGPDTFSAARSTAHDGVDPPSEPGRAPTIPAPAEPGAPPAPDTGSSHEAPVGPCHAALTTSPATSVPGGAAAVFGADPAADDVGSPPDPGSRPG